MADVNPNVRAAYTFVWTVENFTRSIELEYFISPRFLVDWSEKIVFHLAFRAIDTKPYIDCVLGAGDDNTLKDIEIDCELSLIDAKGRPLITKKGQRRPDQNYAYEFPSLVRKNVLLKRVSEFLPNDTLTFRCSLRKAGMKVERPALCFGRSEVGNDFYYWPIERFSSLKIGQKKCFQLQPKLHVIPTLNVNLNLSSNGEYVQLEISCGNEEVYNDTKWEISLIDYEGKVFACENWNWKCGYERETHFFPQFAKKSALLGKKCIYLPNDVLLFRCDCTRVMSEILFDNQASNVEEKYKHDRKASAHEVEKNTLTRSRSVSIPNPCTTTRKSVSVEIDSKENKPEEEFSTLLRQDLMNLFNDHSLSDVVLQAGTETFQVHRAVLGARSPVFKEMFQSGFEQIEKKVEKLDLDAKTLRKLLLYIYTGVVGDLEWDVAAELYSAASKYELIPLKEMCLNFLMTNLCTSNACDILILVQHDEAMKTIVKEFFLDFGTDIIRSENWKKFRKNHPELASEIMEFIYLQKIDN
ncbi:Protein roadkill like protein [Argiope bruennichi]|uniref:Protein roadkill like protein n=1 Tax=Argiope bruennichi TaxID=94029 RepID=A0A8T0EIC5_ARGBR|nr:Protein roadkill like protein [Argiope bruennichi]